MEDLSSQFRLIVNPKARMVKKNFLKNVRFWENYLEREQYRVPETLDALVGDVREFSEQGAGYLGVLGGDGTLHQVATALINHTSPPYPVVLPLRGGTMNSVANNIGQKDPPEKVLPDFLSNLASGHTSSGIIKYVIRVEENNDEGQRVFYCFSFANGVIIRFFSEYYSHPDPGFKQALSLIVFRIFLGGLLSTSSAKEFLAPMEMEINAENQDIPSGKVNIILASSLDNPVLWIRPFGAELNGQPMFHCLVNSMERKDLIKNLWDLFVARCEHPLHWSAQIQDIEIRSKEGYTLDGEVYSVQGPSRIRLSTGPGICFLKG